MPAAHLPVQFVLQVDGVHPNRGFGAGHPAGEPVALAGRYGVEQLLVQRWGGHQCAVV
jgi:hypothetical protein